MATTMRILGRLLQPQIFIIMAVEFVISAVFVFLLLRPVFVGFGASSYTHLGGACFVAAGAVLAAGACGLYRADIFTANRTLSTGLGLVCLIALATALLTGHAFAGASGSPFVDDSLWPFGVLLGWLMTLAVSRGAFRMVLVRGLLTAPARPGPGGLDAGRVRVASPVWFGPLQPGGVPAPIVHAATVPAEDVALAGDPAARMAQFRPVGIDASRGPIGWLDPDSLGTSWLASARALQGSKTGTVLRRASDILLSWVLILFTLPLMVLTALAIRLDSSGPIFYRQERVGLAGRGFSVWKFRSMVADAEAQTGPAWARQRDPRITRVGGVIRLTRIDELPQLLNVLRGEMSLIGPRPERPHFVETLAAVLPRYPDRHVIKPGLTGWAQVNYPYGASVEDARAKLAFDLYYIQHRNMLLDIRILLATIRVVLFREGAR